MKKLAKWIGASVIGLVIAMGIVRASGAGAASGTASASLPGKISLPAGWVQKAERGIDSSPGTITRQADGLKISYDIGMMAGQAVRGADPTKQLWYQEQTIRGRTVRLQLVKGQDDSNSLTVTFADAPANFFVSVQKMEDLADALVAILSYDYDMPAGQQGTPRSPIDPPNSK